MDKGHAVIVRVCCSNPRYMLFCFLEISFSIFFCPFVSILNKSENATLQKFMFYEKVLDKTYLLKLTNVSETSSKRFVETPLMSELFSFCVLSFIH